jgi:Ca2+-binding RTX toxin-like protein
LVVAAHPATAAAESCAYDAGTRAVTAVIDPGEDATLELAASGEIRFGATPAACGAATTANTDSISIAGAAGTTESLTIDESAGFLGPGFSSETNFPEIETAVTLGDAGDVVAVIGTSGSDSIAIGANGLSLNADGDVDVTFSPLPSTIEISGGPGASFLTGRGGWGAGLAFNGDATLIGGDVADELNGGGGNDVIHGGGGTDVISGYAGNDQIDGGGGDDALNGSDGDDTIAGGAGADIMNGGFDNDVLNADDDEADVQIHGGPGTDTAYYDADPATIAVENPVAS